EVRECHMMMGEADFLLKIVSKDWDAFQRFLTSKLTAAPLVSNVKTALVIRNRKRLPGVPIEDVPDDVDDENETDE
ncbi:MAG: Lrp/AsnC ligand binding domain-containing protein, partial [Alphaproteobacteria bacterium]|nr:Lrp/AsnC ligand binding domain-containing protein [Alphaproteobacteria bacterium]